MILIVMLIIDKHYYQYCSYIVFWKINMQTIHKLSKKWTRSLFKGLTHYRISPSRRTFWEKFTEIKKTNLSCEEKDFSLDFLKLKRGLCKICFKWPTLVITHIPHKGWPSLFNPSHCFQWRTTQTGISALRLHHIQVFTSLIQPHFNGVCLASVSSVYKKKTDFRTFLFFFCSSLNPRV